MKETEKHIIKQILGGDVAAFAVLVDKYRHMAFTLALSIVKCSEEAEEIVQDSFLKAFRSLAMFEGRSSFSSWLYQIVYRTSISAYRLKKINLADIEGNELKDRIPASESVSDSLIENGERQEILDRALGRLDEDDAFLVILYYYKELSVVEIQGITGLTVSNIKVKLHRARKQLYVELAGMLKGELPEIL